MNTDNYKPFIATGELLEKIHQFHRERVGSIETRNALFAKYGAKNGWGTDSGLTALLFDKSPEGWRYERSSGAYKPPLGNAGKEIRKELAGSRILGGSDFSHLIGVGGCLSSSGNGGLCMRYAHYEQIGDTMILMIPSVETWSHPDARELKMSEYFALKEAAPQPA